MPSILSIARLLGWSGGNSHENRFDGSIVPDADAYKSNREGGMRVFQPYLVDSDIAFLIRDLEALGRMTLVDRDRLWTLKCAVLQTHSLPGEIWEAGVYQGGSALFLKRLAKAHESPDAPVHMRLFDTFSGLPDTDTAKDLHSKGDFGDTSIEEVQRLVGIDSFIEYHRGLVPESFVGLEDSRVRLAHIDLDLYQGTRCALDFIFPRVVPGGVIVCDDYGFISCPGVRRAVDEFFATKAESPLVLPTGQAVVHRLSHNS